MKHQNNLDFKKFKVINKPIFKSDKPSTIFEIVLSDYESKNISKNKIHKDYLFILYKLEKANKSLKNMEKLCESNCLLKKSNIDTKMYAQWEIIDEYDNFLSSIVAIQDYLYYYKLKSRNSNTLLGFMKSKYNDECKIFLNNFFVISDLELCKATRNYFVHEGYQYPSRFEDAPLLCKIEEINRKFNVIPFERYHILKFSNEIYNNTANFIINLIALEIENGRFNKK